MSDSSITEEAALAAWAALPKVRVWEFYWLPSDGEERLVHVGIGYEAQAIACLGRLRSQQVPGSPPYQYRLAADQDRLDGVPFWPRRSI